MSNTETVVETATDHTEPIEMVADQPVEPPPEPAPEPASKPTPESAPEPAPELPPPEVSQNPDASAEQSPSSSIDNAVGEAIKDQNFITNQLSDAISQILFASFDDASKKLTSRNQAEVLDSTTLDAKVVQPDHFVISSSPAFKVPHQRNTEFAGRIAALSQLFGMWNPGQTSQARIAIVGLGGIG